MSKIEQHFINKAVDLRRELKQCKWYQFKKKYNLRKDITMYINLAIKFSK